MRRRVAGVLLAAVAGLGVSAPAEADSRDPIRGYRVAATPQNLEKLALAGFDVTEGRRGNGVVEVYGTSAQLKKFAAGENVKVTRVAKGASGKQARARAAQASPYTGSDAQWTVWTRYDRVPGDGKEQYLEQYDRLAQKSIVKREVIGKTYLGRDIVALKVTKNAKHTRDNSRPAVLYNALQHAREWLAGETCRRSLDYFVDGYGTDEQVTRLVNTRELWFVCVNNPDGYEYTFTAENRLWRKNMADNDGDGIRGEANDGVDPNRNFPESWGMDNEGSSPDFPSETYRGPGPASEPETKAMLKLFKAVDFKFEKNDHTAAELLLYPQGNQIFTRTPDHSIFTALAGSDGELSAIKDEEEQFDPDLGAELYITNGDTLDTAYNTYGILAYTPEGTNAHNPNVTGFEYEDDEASIEKEWQRHKAFTIDLAESADDPANPDSHLGNTVEDFYVDAFQESYGDPQPVEVTAKRSLGSIVMKYTINDGRTHTTSTKRWRGGERYEKEPGAYYQRLRGTVRGTRPGDKVKVWFESTRKHRSSDSFTYDAEVESHNRVLILGAENRNGSNPFPPVGGPPQYLSYYTDALDALGVGYDLYDTDDQGSHSAHRLGVLSHYDLVVWYTGDDFLTRMPTQPGGTGYARLAEEQMVDVRDYMNEGGKLFFTGQNAGHQYAMPTAVEFRNFDFPEGDEGEGGRWCDGDPFQTEEEDGCIPPNNDFLQYWLGGAVYVSGGTSTDPDGNILDVLGVSPPFEPLSFALNGPDSAENQYHSATLGITSSILPPDEFPDFASAALGVWDRKGAPGPFQPTSGTQYAFSGADSGAYKRLRQEIDLTGKTSAELQFKTSYLLEADWDFMAVEVHEVGSDNWTTLPDANGHNSQSTGATAANSSCGNGWSAGANPLHPFLGHYQRLNPADPDGCDPVGTTGEWWGSTGQSDGWEDWKIDLSAYAGKNIEVAISVITDWGTLDLGVFVDDAKVIVDGATLNETPFEPDFGAWTVGPAPEQTPNPVDGWAISNELFEEAPLVGTPDSVYAAFGFEAINGADSRKAFMEKVLQHLFARRR
jgi:zinc carboxypeptidase/immune inhibitor InhA-like protein